MLRRQDRLVTQRGKLLVGGSTIRIHLPNQLIGRAEFHLGPYPADEGDIDFLAVNIAGKIEQENLE